jgi:ankyrin repeat protein
MVCLLLVVCSTFSKGEADPAAGPNESGHYPIHLAVAAGDIEKVKLLIAQGADVNQRQQLRRNPKGGEPPLYHAFDHPEIMGQLIDAGADVNLIASRDSLITRAAGRGKTKAVELLLKHDAIINDAKRSPPLLAAIRGGHLKIAKNLVEHGAEFHHPPVQDEPPWETAVDSQDAFSSAVGQGDLPLVESMLLRGANPHHISACCVAASKGQLKVLQHLIELRREDRAIGIGVLNAAVTSAAAFNQQEVVDFLLESGALRIASMTGRNEALRRAVWTGNRELAEQLHQGLKAKLDLGCLAGLGLMKDLRGQLEHNRHRVYELNTDYPGIYMTPLHAAAMNGRTDAVDYLLGLGAGPSSPDQHGFTPLHLAVRHGHHETAKRLLDGGANQNATTLDLVGGSVSVFLEALRKHDFAMISLLDKGGADQIAKNSFNLDIGLAKRLVTFARWIDAGELLDRALADKVKHEVEAHPPLWSKEFETADQPKQTLRAFKWGDGYHQKISVALVLTNPENQVLSSVTFPTPTFSMEYTDAHIESDIQQTKDGPLITLHFVKTSIKDWSLQLRKSGGELLRTQDPPLKLNAAGL